MYQEPDLVMASPELFSFMVFKMLNTKAPLLPSQSVLTYRHPIVPNPMAHWEHYREHGIRSDFSFSYPRSPGKSVPLTEMFEALKFPDPPKKAPPLRPNRLWASMAKIYEGMHA